MKHQFPSCQHEYVDLPVASVRQQLAKITASRGFRQSERMCRFLAFCVEAALRGEAPKEYTVGTAVFDRKADYDPRVDPIVRVEARRLRAKLEEYYAEATNGDEIVIELPKGSYVPVLRRRSDHKEEARPPATSIAVLPFSNLSPGSDDDYFSDGLTEELIHRLTRIPRLRVLAWPSASRLRGREEDVRGIRDQLSVDLVLRGSVRRGGGQLRITAQLVDAASGEFRWSESYSRAMSDLLAVQEEIAGAIASTLRLTLSPQARRESTNVEAHNLCLWGRHLTGQRTVDALRRSVTCYQQAIEIDPQSAVAFTGLADGLILLAEYGDVRPDRTMEQARDAALQALALDPLSAEAHTSLAILRSHLEWNWEAAGELYRRAIELNPGYARARHWYGLDYLGLLGRTEESMVQLKAARELDPLSAIIIEGVANIYVYRRDYEAALAELRSLVELEPSFAKAYAAMGRVYALQGRYGEALEMFDRSRVHAGDLPSTLGARGQVYALLGERARAIECLEALRGMSLEKFVPYAVVYLGLGEHSKAIDALEQAADRRETSVVACGVHPLWDPIRGEPRFQDLLKRVGFLR